MKRVWMIALFSVIQSGAVCANGQGVDDQVMAQMREEAANALGEMLSMVRINRTVADASYKSLESSLNPKTYKRILAMRDKIAKLSAEKEELLNSPNFGPNHDMTKRAEFNLVDAKNELEDLMRNEKVLHWRTFLALGTGLTVGTLWWRLRKKGIWGKSWRAVWYGFLTTSIVEFLLRTRHAVVPGLFFRAFKELFKGMAKGAEKVFGTQGASDRVGRWFEDVLETKAGRDIDNALKGPLGPILASVVSVGAIAAAAKFTRNRKPN